MCSLGSYITVRSNIGQLGDQVTLFSPTKTFDKGTRLKFSYHMLISDEDTTAALTVHTYSASHVYGESLLEIRGNQGSGWQTTYVCLPKGTYQLAFVATHGLQFLSDIALNRIELHNDDNCISPIVTGKQYWSSKKQNPYSFFLSTHRQNSYIFIAEFVLGI